MEVAQRRRQKDAQRRQKEMERGAKEREKLSAAEQARLEVETYDRRMEDLLSLHKEKSEEWDWIAISASLPPPKPLQNTWNEQRVRQGLAVLLDGERADAQNLIDQARLQDKEGFNRATEIYGEEMAQMDKLKNLAARILAGEHRAFTETLVEYNPFAQISDLGSSMNFTVHTAKLIECALKVNGKQAIPTEVKTLTSSGKLSVKPMTKTRFHEIYQDYVCGCVLRVARELFALFPLDTILVAATVDLNITPTEETVERPILSVAVTRAALSKVDFQKLDPSDLIHNFQHRGDLKASRKSELFQAVVPLTLADMGQTSVKDMALDEIIANAQRVRNEIKTEIDVMRQNRF